MQQAFDHPVLVKWRQNNDADSSQMARHSIPMPHTAITASYSSNSHRHHVFPRAWSSSTESSPRLDPNKRGEGILSQNASNCDEEPRGHDEEQRSKISTIETFQRESKSDIISMSLSARIHEGHRLHCGSSTGRCRISG